MTHPAYEHEPVLVEPLLRIVAPAAGEWVFDGTVGLGGHASAIVPRIRPDGSYIGVDLDGDMLTTARERLAEYGDRVRLIAGNFADARAILGEQGIDAVDVLLLDLGVNSAQLDDAGRGFSFDRDGPLDMRFDRSAATRALDLINRLSERELADMFYEFGQEGLSRKIAKRICQVRHGGRITTTLVLARAVESALASAGDAGGKIHPATRVFQALRVAVNGEFDNLRRFLGQAFDLLRPGGRLAVISFHSLEDGLVKQAMREAVATGRAEELTRRPVVAEEPERSQNPRSRSAKLRVARRRMET
ncbi:MAG: 16S rRNA (cytosine(1402)-N(4))-methyltransferase RsmH [Phycisphaerae bacterium]